MKLSGRDSAAFCRSPDAGLKGALLYGPDPATVSAARREALLRLSEGDDLRITRLDGAALRRDPAALDEAVRARGFFPGRRIAHVEGARDDIAELVHDVLESAGPEDAFLLLEAGALTAKSALRKVFEKSREAAACGLYPDPPDIGELGELLRRAGLTCGLTTDAEAALAAAVAESNRAQVSDITEKIALFGAGRETPLELHEILALLPAAAEAELDRLIEAVAAGQAGEVVSLLGRATTGGTAPVQALIFAGRHFRQLHALVSAPEGLDAALSGLRPPVYGPRRTSLMRQARAWPLPRIEAALRLLQESDRALRSPGARPDRALVERCLIRIAMMGARR